MNVDCHFHICLPNNTTPIIGKFAVELAGLLGFHSLALDFPIVSSSPSTTPGDFNIVISPEFSANERTTNRLKLRVDQQSTADKLLQDVAADLSAWLPTGERAQVASSPTDFKFSSDSPLLDPVHETQRPGIENFLLTSSWLKDTDGDFLPDLLDVGITLADDANLDIYAAAADVAAVLASQTTVYRYPICDPNRTGRIHFSPTDAPASVRVVDDCIHFEGANLSPFTTSLLKLLLPDQQGVAPSRLLGKDGRPLVTLPLKSWLDHLRDDLAMRQTDGQFAWAVSLRATEDPQVLSLFNPDAREWNRRTRLLPKQQVGSFKDDHVVWEINRSLKWEVDRFKALFDKKVLPKLKKGDQLELIGALSEDQHVRGQLVSELSSLVESRGANATIQLVSAYKQGYSWLDEYVCPQLQQLEHLETVQILFKAYLPDGKTEFLQEDGATPKITSERVDDPEHWFDLPIRPLQEIYPIDDTLSQKLSIDRSKIHFDYYLGEKDLTYEVLAFDKEGQLLLRREFKTIWAERPYLDRYPDLGKVHPPTGSLKTVLNGELLLDERVETDLELIWNIYQAEVLPAVTNYIFRKTGGAVTAANQPFFSKLEIRLDVSEPDFDLLSRTDRISALDALHEDLYFVGLDYFRTMGLRETGEKISSPGLILPVIRKTIGRPKVHVRLTESNSSVPQITKDGKILASALKREDVRATITSIAQSPQGFAIELSIHGPRELESVLESYGKLLQRLRLKNSIDGCGVATIHGSLNDKPFSTWRLPHPALRSLKTKPLDPSDFHVTQTEVIGYQEYLKLIQQAQRLSGLRVYPIAESYQGRMIHAIEVLPEARGWLPRTKWITAQPSVYINARHHANEVSSTNSNFRLAKALLSDLATQNLAKSLNIVLVPFENADGAAIHYNLMQDNPRWKLHVARYNALGTELAQEYFKEDTIQSEALAFTRVWQSILPDVIVDDHGVPTHEWDQPFSGYTSPWFKGFWLPRALLYGYFFHIKDDRFDKNMLVNQAVEHAVALSLKTDENIIAGNKDWRDRFYTYANKWLPLLFPANYYQDMISYWIPSPYTQIHNYASVRFPWVTAASFVSEVCDETAQGDHLTLCALAHYNQDVAILQLMADSKVCLDQTTSTDSKNGELIWRRKRPIICPNRDQIAEAQQEV